MWKIAILFIGSIFIGMSTMVNRPDGNIRLFDKNHLLIILLIIIGSVLIRLSV